MMNQGFVTLIEESFAETEEIMALVGCNTYLKNFLVHD
jgi:hypothetical protein